MAKKIAVVVRDRQSEALRMAVGIILLDDTIAVFVLDRPVEASEQNQLYLETIADLELETYTNCEENRTMRFLSTPELAKKLLEYDHIVFY